MYRITGNVSSYALVAFLVLATAVALPTEKVKHYHGYKVIRALPETQAHFQAIRELIVKEKYDFWREPSVNGGPADVMLSPTEYDEVVNFLQAHGISYHTMIPDVEEVVQRQSARYHAKTPRDMDWEDYHTWDEVNTWLSTLVEGSVNSSLITSEKYGSSLEGRDLLVYKVSTGGAGPKLAVWIDATIHAREHITTAVITYMINELVGNSTEYADILQHVDFYFAPFINPDGFVYSHEFDRMWRKTRSNWLNSSCIGVDANRNYGFEWGDDEGSSDNPCSGSYRGPEPFSEPETKYMRDYILGKGQNESVAWEMYITLHSYSQLWMSPWGYTHEVPEDHVEVLQVANDAVAELERHFNTSYTTGNSGAVLYPTSGSSQDWAKGEGGFKYVYTVELRDTGRYGFLLPPEQIVDTSVETWAAVQVAARDIIQSRLQK